LDHLVGARDQRRRHCEAEPLAVLRLIASSNFVGNSTGRSPGSIAVGKEFKQELDKDPTHGRGQFIESISEIARRLQGRDRATPHPEKDCELVCKLTDEQREALRQSKNFTFLWVGLNFPRRALSTSREIAEQVNALRKQAEATAWQKAQQEIDVTRQKVRQIRR
jgi:hypothetical protein